MIQFDVDVLGADEVIRALDQSALAIRRGNDIGIRAATREAYNIARPMIPIASGRTQRRLRMTYRREQGLLSGRVGVRAPRAHIMRFYEEGTKSHGRYGGPLPAHKVFEKVKLIVLPRVNLYVDIAINAELIGIGLGI